MDLVNRMMGLDVATATINFAAFFVIASSLIQISPIKINPWSWIARRIGKAMNKEVIDKVDDLEGDIKSIRHDLDEKSARDARTKIIRFGDEIYHGVKHSKEHYDEILSIITDYDSYCNEHADFKNHVAESTKKMILDSYDQHMIEHDFI